MTLLSTIDHPHAASGITDDLSLIHADEHLLAFNKPSGLLSVPGRGPDKQDCLASRAQTHWHDALVVHRLDMATSGLIVMARGLEMQRRLSASFANRQTAKDYVALVDGWMTEDCGEVDLPLICDWPNRPRQIVNHDIGKAALTRWQVLTREHDPLGQLQTRVLLSPITGRSHQLRVHMQAIGHPILGDSLYAPCSVQTRASRLLLHAWRLDLPHPDHGQQLALTCSIPF